MSDKRKRLTINLTPTPAELYAEQQRHRAAMQALLDQMMKDALDG